MGLGPGEALNCLSLRGASRLDNSAPQLSSFHFVVRLNSGILLYPLAIVQKGNRETNSSHLNTGPSSALTTFKTYGGSQVFPS